MTQNDIIRRIIKQNGGCQEISCRGCEGSWNQGTECPLSESKCTDNARVALMAKAWADERNMPLYSSSFTIEHRFKPGDRVQHNDTTGPHPFVITVAELIFGADCGVFYRFAEDRVPTGSVSYCDENMRLADCDDETEKAKEMP